MTHDEQAEVLHHRISDVDRLARHFDTLRKKVSDMVEKAQYDPAAAERLVELERVWNNGMQQKADQMQQYMKQILQTGTQYRRMKRQLNNNTSEEVKRSDIGMVPPAQKSQIRRKIRRFV